MERRVLLAKWQTDESARRRLGLALGLGLGLGWWQFDETCCSCWRTEDGVT